jgi:riboflavin kinase/FMN adenylyltransferase
MLVLEWSRFITGGLEGAFPGSDWKTAVTVGVFDGIHRGHQRLIEKIVRKRPECIPTVITFRQNPKEALKKPGWAGDILSLDRKLALFENLGVAVVILIDFSVNFSKLSGKEFIDLLIRWGRTGYVVVGGNFRCGYRMDTDAARIKGLMNGAGIPAEVAAPVLEGPYPVSSSRIRSAISAGELSRAALLLGRNVEVDCGGMTSVPRDGGRFYPIDPRLRIIPAPGRYLALLYGRNAGGTLAGVAGTEVPAEVFVEREGIFVPLQSGVERIEFLGSDR